VNRKSFNAEAAENAEKNKEKTERGKKRERHNLVVDM
jgi:hypothetical protein